MIKIIKRLGFMTFLLGTTLLFHMNAKATGTYEDYTYTVSDGEVTITGYSGGETDITIPDTVDGYQVTNIGVDAFYKNKTIVSVVIPKTVKIIEQFAFYNAINLREVTIENGCEKILANAFGLCSNLTKIVIPKSVTTFEYVDSGNKIFDGDYFLIAYIEPKSAAQTYLDTYEDDIQYYFLDEYVPTSIEFVNPTLTINVGDTYTFSKEDFNVLPSTAYITMPSEYSESDSNIAYVSNGILTARKEGTITVNATIHDEHLENDITTTALTVNVVESRKKVERVSLNVSDVVEMNVGDTLQLQATVTPSDATYTASWGTSKSDVANISETGMVTALSAGTAQVGFDTRSIFGNVNDNNGKYILIKVSENPTRAAESVTFNVGSTTTMYVGDTLQLETTVLPSDAVYTGCWYSNSFGAEGIVSLSTSGSVTALKEGYVRIEYVTMTDGSNGASGLLDVYVKEKPTATDDTGSTDQTDSTDNSSSTDNTNNTENTDNISTTDLELKQGKITLNASKINLQKGKTIKTLTIKVNQLEGDQIASVTSSNKKVLKVSLSGQTIVLKGLKTYKKYVTVTVKMQSGATAACKVKVVSSQVKTKKLTLSEKKLTIEKGNKAQITVTRNPISATDKITYKSSNTKIATVDKNGKIKAKKKGKVKITVTSASKKKATCTVTVN
ncbi:Ig-like protein group 2 [Lachnotalea glycerini]|uniref:Ig-like protein group 2 n=1 Tax=Lachnotalea glycerini TaxID=1763509 RepID=A0A318ES08_9FIRM|nr:Ig-like domain-containing protein [Lachnotalea glycerini]PXV89571.1 Ig-like protein group 2 [Lachnotalea glycerini]